MAERILFLSSVGVTLRHFVADLAAEMQTFGYETVGVAGSMVDVPGFDTLHELPPFRRQGPADIARAYRALEQIVRGSRPDLLHLHTPFALALGRVAARRAGVPSLAVAHGTLLRPLGIHALIYAMCEAPAARLAAETICENEEDARFYRRFCRQDSVSVAPVGGLGLDMDRLHLARTTPIRLAARPSIVVVGRLTPDKNLDRVMEAFHLLREREPRASLTFIGSAVGGELAWEVPKESGVEHVKWVEDPYPLIAGADLLISASRREGFSLTVAEAIALGVPVVAVDNRGVRQVVRSGAIGLTIVPDDRAALALRMLETLHQEPKVLVQPGHDWSRRSALDFHRAAIERVLAKRRGPRASERHIA